MVGNLIVGGHDTTASQIGCSLLALLRHPEALADLRADPSLAGAVVNETIRFEPSISVVPRTLVEPVEIGGVERPAGSLVFLSSASTSRQGRRVGRSRCVPARTVHRARCAQTAVVRIRRRTTASAPRSLA